MHATYLCERAIEEDVSSDQHIPDSMMWHLPCTKAQYNASYHITSHNTIIALDIFMSCKE